ncbi:MAG: hypothetical protein KDA75_18700, partial [Planctomycetaceae bacterium]|nr:hypothetical protein [Planctomycetaceae bacterium]
CRFLIAFSGIGLPALPLAGDEFADRAAQQLTTAIQQGGLHRVGVLPILFEESTRYDMSASERKLESSPLGRLYADELQSALIDLSGSDYALLDSVELVAALRVAFDDPQQFLGTRRDIDRLASKVDGGIDGIIVGSINDRPQAPDSQLSVRDVSWKLMDVRSGTVQIQPRRTGDLSLAEAVYNGLSHEFYRWKDGRLAAVGFGWSPPPRNLMPLRAEDSLDLYSVMLGAEGQPNPALNPNCPFKIKFLVDGQNRPVTLPVNREIMRIGLPPDMGGDRQLGNSGLYGNLDSLDDFFGGNRRSTPAPRRPAVQDNRPQGHQLLGNSAYLPLHPGESLHIGVRNDSERQVLVAVYVDGVNILGKERTLPDSRCRVWRAEPGRASAFSGWFTGERGSEQVEEFVVVPWEDSVAAKLGSQDRAGTITIIWYQSGAGDNDRWNLVSTFPRTYMFDGYWSPQQRRVIVAEGLAPPGVAAAGGNFGFGGKPPQPHALRYGPAGNPGALLAATTVHYAPRTELPTIIKDRLLQSQSWMVDKDRSPAQQSQYMLVESPTNGQ